MANVTAGQVPGIRLDIDARPIVFAFPLVFLAGAYSLLVYAPDTYRALFGILEEGLFERAQFACYLAAAALGLDAARRMPAHGRARRQRTLMILFTLGCAFVAFEEISWGQHIFGWTTNEFFAQANLQNETNLHNLGAIQGRNLQAKAFILVGCAGGFAWLLRLGAKHAGIRDLACPEWYLSSYFLPIAVYYTQLLYFSGANYRHQETFETVLGFGFLGVALVNRAKARAR